MIRAITVAGALACGAMLTGCAANDTTPLNTSDQGPAPAEPTEVAPLAFEVWLRDDTTLETVIPQILAAGQDQLAAACHEYPGTSIRVFNPLASGDYVDVPCTSAPIGNELNGEASAALTRDPRDERIGLSQQKLSPVGFVCSALMFGSGLIGTYALCPRATNPQDERNCGHVSNFGFGGLGFLCFLL